MEAHAQRGECEYIFIALVSFETYNNLLVGNIEQFTH